MPVGQVGVMSGFLVVARFMVSGGFPVVIRRLFMMLGGLSVMVRSFGRHG